MNGFPSVMSWLVKSALCGSVVIVVLLVLRPFIRRWLGARAVHALWLVVLVRLLIPWTPRTPMAVLPAPVENRVAKESVTVRAFVVGRHQEEITPPVMTPERNPEPGAAIPAGAIGVIWLLGAVGVFGLSLAGAWRAAPLLRRAREIAPESVAMRMLASLPISVRGMRILETDELKSPALCGFIRPTILLPPGWAESMAPEELRCVLLHEIGHHRRGDVLWRWVFLLARAIHWFNPLVWLAEREMRIDQEMACDEWVLAHADGIDARGYGSALLQACRNMAAPGFSSPGHATMAESSSGLVKRIRHLARAKPRGWPAVAGVAGLAAAFLAIGPASTGAEQAPAEPKNLPKTAAPAAIIPPPVPSPALPPVPVAKARQIEIQARFIEVDSGKLLKSFAQAFPEGVLGSSPFRGASIFADEQLQKILRWLGQKKGVDLTTAPRVRCPSGQRAIIEEVREFRYPTDMEPANDGTGRAVPTAFEMRNTGVTMDVLPVIETGDRIAMTLAPSIVEFAGYVNYGAGRPARRTLAGDALDELMKNPSAKHIINQPIFETRKITTAASIESGQTVLIGGILRTDSQTVTDESKTVRGGKPVVVKKTYEEKIERYLLIFVTARILSAEEAASAVSVEPATRPKYLDTQAPFSARTDLPVAAAVPEKPGFVISPYAPGSGFVDVRGFASGTQVKCPYSGLMFVTP